MKRKHSKKFIMRYLSTILSWALFVYLVLIAVFLIYYFIVIKVVNKDDVNPPISIYTIVSGSMRPTIDVYDVVLNIKIDSPTEIKEGDIITFISQSSISKDLTVTHRVKDIQKVNGEFQFITQGDNNVMSDSSPATFDKIIGKAVLRIPQLGKVQAFIASRFGWLVVVILPALYVILKDVIKLVKITKLQKESNDEKNKLIDKDEKQYDENNLDDIIEDERKD